MTVAFACYKDPAAAARERIAANSLRERKIVYSKSARAWTNVPSTFRAMIKQQVRWKKSFHVATRPGRQPGRSDNS